MFRLFIARQVIDRICPWSNTWLVHVANWLDPYGLTSVNREQEVQNLEARQNEWRRIKVLAFIAFVALL